MLENSDLVSGKQAKELEALCESYNDLTLQITDLTTIKKNVGSGIKEICNHAGIFETTNYCVKMTQIADKTSLDSNLIEEYLKKKYPEILDEIYANCMKTTYGYLKFGSITRKGKRV